MNFKPILCALALVASASANATAAPPPATTSTSNNSFGPNDICVDDGSLVPIIPFADPTVLVNGVETAWSGLTREQWNRILGLQDIAVSVYRREQDRSLTLLPSKIADRKGTYLLTYQYMQFTNEPIDIGGRRVGYARIGVGIRVDAEINTRSQNINLSDIMPIAIGYHNTKLTGRMRIRAWGISSGDAILRPYLKAVSDMTPAALAELLEAVGVAKTILSQEDAAVSPYFMAIQECHPGDLAAAVSQFQAAHPAQAQVGATSVNP